MGAGSGPGWAGWFRPKGRLTWQRLTEGDSYDGALDLLLKAAPCSSDLVVLRAGEHPDSQQTKALSGQQLRHPPAMPGREDRR